MFVCMYVCMYVHMYVCMYVNSAVSLYARDAFLKTSHNSKLIIFRRNNHKAGRGGGAVISERMNQQNSIFEHTFAAQY